jgi:hypothetical protein
VRLSALGRGSYAALRQAQGPSRGHKRPILLLPGVYETWHFLEAVGLHLRTRGHRVHVVPEFGRNIRPIAEMATLANNYLAAHELTDVAIVAHSKGGLIGKTVMISDVGESRVSSMVTVNTPFSGSDYAHLIPIRTLREFVPGHETLVTLARSAEVNSRITSLFSVWDPTVPNGSFLTGATNIELPITGHFRILDKQPLLNAVARAVSHP